MEALGDASLTDEDLAAIRMISNSFPQALQQVEEVLARRWPLADLGLTAQEIHAARLRFVQQAAGLYLLRLTDPPDYTVTHYIYTGVTPLTEVTPDPVHQSVLEQITHSNAVLDSDDPEMKAHIDMLNRAFESVRSHSRSTAIS